MKYEILESEINVGIIWKVNTHTVNTVGCYAERTKLPTSYIIRLGLDFIVKHLINSVVSKHDFLDRYLFYIWKSPGWWGITITFRGFPRRRGITIRLLFDSRRRHITIMSLPIKKKKYRLSPTILFQGGFLTTDSNNQVESAVETLPEKNGKHKKWDSVTITGLKLYYRYLLNQKTCLFSRNVAFFVEATYFQFPESTSIDLCLVWQVNWRFISVNHDLSPGLQLSS